MNFNFNKKNNQNKNIINKKIQFNIEITNDYKNVQRLFNLQLNINENNNNNTENILENISYFLADEFQLCTFTKLKKINKYFDKTNLKKPYSDWINIIKNQLIPVPMGITQESIDYQFMGLYNLLEYLPIKKKVMIFKPLSKKNLKNNTLYLYQNIEPYLISNNNCTTNTVFTYISQNDHDKLHYDNIYDNGLKNYKLLNEENIFENNNEKYEYIYIKYAYVEKSSFFSPKEAKRSVSETSDSNSQIENELYSLDIFLYQLFYSLKFLVEGGDLMVDISFISSCLPNIQILYFLKNIFEEMKFVKSDLYINDIQSGFFIFSKLKKSFHLNKYNLSSNVTKLFNNKLLTKNNNNSQNKYISSLFQNELSNEFKKYLNDLYLKIFNEYQKYEDKKNFLLNELKIKPFSFQKYVDFMVEKSIDWCVKYKIPINNIYIHFHDKKIPDNLKFKFFPHEKGIDLRKIKMTTESIYSVTFPKEADQISNLIKKYYPDCKTIVDTSANVGGNSLSFSKNFEKVISIEIDPETKNALENNINLYKRNNVEVILGDYVNLKDSLKGDVYFFDPPWGGIYYKIEQNMNLYLSNIDIIDLLPKNFVLKAPINYNIQQIIQKYKNIQIYYLTNFIVLIPNYNISEFEMMDKGYYY